MLRDRLHEDRIEEYLAYLADTDVEYARLKAEVERTKQRAKRAEAREVIGADNKQTALEKKAFAELATQGVWDKHFDAIQAFEELKAKRETADRHMTVWLTYTSGRSKGLQI